MVNEADHAVGNVSKRGCHQSMGTCYPQFVQFVGNMTSQWNFQCQTVHCFKIISHQAPIHLLELVHLYIPSQQLYSSAGYHPFKQSPVVSDLFLTKFQLPISADAAACQFFQIFFENLSLFKNHPHGASFLCRGCLN